jgi:phosphate uptake regulator
MPRFGGDARVHVGDGLQDALADVRLLVLVAELAGLVLAGRRARGHGRAADEARLERTSTSTVGLPRESSRIEIERAAVQLLTDATRETAQLDENQLRLVLTIVKVNNELERIADAGVDVAELVIPTKGDGSGAYPHANEQALPSTFRVMANSVIGILRDAVGSLMSNDAAMAKVVLQSQHTVTAFKAAIVRDAETKISQGKMTVDYAFFLHEIANLCELVADHCTNIAEQVIYLNTGAIVRHTQTSWVEVGKTKA